MEVVPLAGEAFDRLSRSERLLGYRLAQAAIAAHPVVLLQNGRHDLAVWELVDALAVHAELLDPQFANRLLDYRRRLFLHGGIHDAYTQMKFAPDFTFAELHAAVQRARAAGVNLPAEDALAALEAPIFDPLVDRLRLNKIPGTLRDPVAESAMNHYAPGISSWDLVDFTDQRPLNSRIRREAGVLEEEPYRAGGGEVPPGLGAPYLAAAAAELDAALPLAGAADQDWLRRLAAGVRSGDLTPVEEPSSWIGGTLGFDFGFTDGRSDPREVKGVLEALVVLRDPAADALFARAAALAPAFEGRLPWLPGQRRPAGERAPPALAAVRLAAASGAAFAFPPIGLSWPGRLASRSGLP